MPSVFMKKERKGIPEAGDGRKESSGGYSLRERKEEGTTCLRQGGPFRCPGEGRPPLRPMLRARNEFGGRERVRLTGERACWRRE